MSALPDQTRIWHHFQNAAPQSFAGAWPRLDFLARQIERRCRNRPLSVLNIGIGDGYFERQAMSRGWRIHALDPDEQTVARVAAEGVIAQVGLIERMPFEAGQFDAVVASEVLEHLTEGQRQAGLAEIHRVLRAGGCFLGTVPHAENMAEQPTVCPACGEVFHRWGHQQSFTRESVRAMLAGTFRVERVARTAFVNLWGRGLRGFLKGLPRILLAKLGEPIAVPTIWWVASKPK